MELASNPGRGKEDGGNAAASGLRPSRAELEKWQAHFDENSVESSGIVESPFGLHLSAKDPDKIPLEFFVPTS